MRNQLVTSFCAVLCSWSAFGQAAPPTPAFEVASIKLNDSGDRGSRTNSTNGEVRMQNSPLKGIIMGAYDVRDYSFSGPDWLSTVRFDITAKLPPSDAEKIPKEQRQQARRIMMQKLLAERFKLVTHTETKTLSGYALVVAKKGPKLTPAASKAGTSISNGNDRLDGQGMSMANLATLLGNQLQGPVADMTGLAGRYDIKLEWSLDDGKAGGGDSDGKAATDSRPSIFTALQETLGLRLETRKIPVEILVVDHVERTPTEN